MGGVEEGNKHLKNAEDGSAADSPLTVAYDPSNMLKTGVLPHANMGESAAISLHNQNAEHAGAQGVVTAGGLVLGGEYLSPAGNLKPGEALPKAAFKADFWYQADGSGEGMWIKEVHPKRGDVPLDGWKIGEAKGDGWVKVKDAGELASLLTVHGSQDKGAVEAVSLKSVKEIVGKTSGVLTHLIGDLIGLSANLTNRVVEKIVSKTGEKAVEGLLEDREKQAAKAVHPGQRLVNEAESLAAMKMEGEAVRPASDSIHARQADGRLAGVGPGSPMYVAENFDLGDSITPAQTARVRRILQEIPDETGPPSPFGSEPFVIRTADGHATGDLTPTGLGAGDHFREIIRWGKIEANDLMGEVPAKTPDTFQPSKGKPLGHVFSYERGGYEWRVEASAEVVAYGRLGWATEVRRTNPKGVSEFLTRHGTWVVHPHETTRIPFVATLRTGN